VSGPFFCPEAAEHPVITLVVIRRSSAAQSFHNQSAPEPIREGDPSRREVRPAMAMQTEAGDTVGRGSPASGPSPIARVRALARGLAANAIARGSASALALRVGGAGLAFGLQVLLARLLGGEPFGVYSAVWIWVLVLGHMAAGGFGETVVRFLPRHQVRGQAPLARGFVLVGTVTTLAISLALALGAALLILVLGPRIDAGILPALLLACAALPLFAAQDWLEGLARALGRHTLALAPTYILRPLATAAALLAALALGLPGTAEVAVAASLAALLASTLWQALGVLRALRAAGLDPGGPRRTRTQGWVRASLPFMLVLGLDQLGSYADMLALGLLAAPGEVAVYFAAAKVMSIAGLVPYAAAMVVGRQFALAHATADKARLRQAARDAALWTLLGSLVAVIGLALLGRPLLDLFGPGFSAGYPVLLVLGAGLVARSASGQAEEMLAALGHGGVIVRVSGIVALATLALVGALASALGVMGAALGMAFGAALRAFLFAGAARRATGIASTLLPREVWPGLGRVR